MLGFLEGCVGALEVAWYFNTVSTFRATKPLEVRSSLQLSHFPFKSPYLNLSPISKKVSTVAI